MPTFDVECDFEVYCDCGEGICNNCDVENDEKKITVSPCAKCLDAAEQRGYEKGYNDAKKEEYR
jgi:hypothetical protein